MQCAGLLEFGLLVCLGKVLGWRRISPNGKLKRKLVAHGAAPSIGLEPHHPCHTHKQQQADCLRQQALDKQHCSNSNLGNDHACHQLVEHARPNQAPAVIVLQATEQRSKEVSERV